MSQAVDLNIIVHELGSVLWVRVARPQKHNALSTKMLEELGAAFQQARDRQNIKLAVITGTGADSFVAGGDLRELDAVRSRTATRAMSNTGMAALNSIREFPLPVVAALNGAARGGGAELALACDIRIAAPHAQLGLIQGQLNLSTAWGGGADLLRLQTPGQALLTLGQARLLSAAQAQTAGLIEEILKDEVVPELTAWSDELWQQAVLENLAPLLQRPTQVLRAHKALVIEHRRLTGVAAQQALETEQLVATWTHDDHWQAAASALQKSR